MVTALDEIAFLANSGNRKSVFDMLVEAPRSRDEIRDEVDASRVTIARILRELQARNWIEQSGQEYAVTPLGEWVCEEFARLVEEVAAEQRLREPLQWAPTDLFTFDVRRLRDAEVVLLDGSDATALVRRIREFHRSGDRIRGLARESAPEIIENQWALTVQGDTRVELVLTPDILGAIRAHPPSSRRFCEMLDEGNARFLVSEDVPVSVCIVDGSVEINLADEHGTLKGALRTDDERVHAWAVDLFRTHRGRARPVDGDVIRA